MMFDIFQLIIGHWLDLVNTSGFDGVPETIVTSCEICDPPSISSDGEATPPEMQLVGSGGVVILRKDRQW
jgi:hypothetical protein